jgi:transposase
MGKANFSDDFKRDAVAQITERGYPVSEVSRRLGVSPHSLYAWKKKFSQPSGGDDKDAEIRRLKRELTRVTEERDILKNRPRPAARLCAVETACAIFGFGGELPMAYWRHLTPLKNVAHGLMRT